MVKNIFVVALSMMLIGCTPPVIKTVYKTKEIPIYIVPTPPTVPEPVLEVTLLTPEQKNDIGELAKAYSISLKQSTQYACQLKNIVDEYAVLAAASPSLISPVPIPSALSLSLAFPSIQQFITDMKAHPVSLTVPDNVAKDCIK